MCMGGAMMVWCCVFKFAIVDGCEAYCYGVGLKCVGQCMYSFIVPIGAKAINMLISST